MRICVSACAFPDRRFGNRQVSTSHSKDAYAILLPSFVGVTGYMDRVGGAWKRMFVGTCMVVVAVTSVSNSRTNVVMSDSRRVIHHTSSISDACGTQSISVRASRPSNHVRAQARRQTPSDTLTDDSCGLIECIHHGDSVNAAKHVKIERKDKRANPTLYL
jgi:hypothetical protein